MAPHLVRWQSRWADKGLKVVEVEYGQATPLANLRLHLEEERIAHTVCYDATGEITTQRYEVRGFPTAMIIDRAGKVVWHGYPSESPSAVEKALAHALGE